MQLLDQEVRAAAQNEHPNVIKVYGSKAQAVLLKGNGQTQNVAYIVQEYVPNGELLNYILNHGAMSATACKFFFKQLIFGVLHMYQKGFSHRDLKPENILVDQNFNMKIADFGFAM